MKFQYYMPTLILMGENCVLENRAVLAGLGKKALIVTGRNSAKTNGSLEDMKKALMANEQEYEVFDKVVSNPTVDCVYEGTSFAKENGVDFIVALGGGSPMDAAKAIALLSCQDIPREKLFLGGFGDKVLPMAFVPTTAGTGSEVTQYSILTNDAAKTKTSLASPVLFPKVAFLDGKYMKSLSRNVTINTAVDALSHCVEGYLSNKANGISDALALEGMTVIAKQFDNLKAFTLSTDERSKLLYASTLGGMVIAQSGTTAVHSMGYSLTYFKSIDHGRANGLLLAEFLKFIQKEKPEKIELLLEKMRLSSLAEFAGILDALLGEKEAVTAEEAKLYSTIAIQAKNIGNCLVIPTEQDLFALYKAVFGF